ncbi:hypothetical protein CMUS01_13919 [Colletotrichum musicola]|uniref:Uncharacterized protein n=1 Tax=Colletotrichum musicola TaxID=2175873 RepID=A0A8H6J8G8_9PEZI|nr:hypothetical protein CMUS01_13919 [Colletotrichum musicola]
MGADRTLGPSHDTAGGHPTITRRSEAVPENLQLDLQQSRSQRSMKKGTESTESAAQPVLGQSNQTPSLTTAFFFSQICLRSGRAGQPGLGGSGSSSGLGSISDPGTGFHSLLNHCWVLRITLPIKFQLGSFTRSKPCRSLGIEHHFGSCLGGFLNLEFTRAATWQACLGCIPGVSRRMEVPRFAWPFHRFASETAQQWLEASGKQRQRSATQSASVSLDIQRWKRDARTGRSQVPIVPLPNPDFPTVPCPSPADSPLGIAYCVPQTPPYPSTSFTLRPRSTWLPQRSRILELRGPGHQITHTHTPTTTHNNPRFNRTRAATAVRQQSAVDTPPTSDWTEPSPARRPSLTTYYPFHTSIPPTIKEQQGKAGLDTSRPDQRPPATSDWT